jgi:hypothetical protein
MPKNKRGIFLNGDIIGNEKALAPNPLIVSLLMPKVII